MATVTTARKREGAKARKADKIPAEIAQRIHDTLCPQGIAEGLTNVPAGNGSMQRPGPGDAEEQVDLVTVMDKLRDIEGDLSLKLNTYTCEFLERVLHAGEKLVGTNLDRALSLIESYRPKAAPQASSLKSQASLPAGGDPNARSPKSLWCCTGCGALLKTHFPGTCTVCGTGKWSRVSDSEFVGQPRIYKMGKGLVFVHEGIGEPPTFGTFRRRPSGGLQRVKSPHLPMRPTRAEAESDLLDYAEYQDLMPAFPQTSSLKPQADEGTKARGHKGTKLEGDDRVQDPRPKPQDAPLSSASALDGPVGPYAIDSIDPSPFQMRKEFDAAELDGLAASLKQHGLIEPVVIMQSPQAGRYELVAGERRLRAAKLAGWTTIQAKLVDVSRAEAQELVLLENLQRADLNAIEKARSYELLLYRSGATQQSVAERLGVSQPMIANAIALLKLPKDWQERIISGEITPTQARQLAPWRERPAVLAAIAEEAGLAKRGKGKGGRGEGDAQTNEAADGPALSSDDLKDAVSFSAREQSRALGGSEWDRHRHRQVPCFKPTPAQCAELDIVTVEIFGRKEKRAFNVKLFDRLQAAHANKHCTEHPEGKNGRAKAAGQPRKLSPAEERERARVHAEQGRRRRIEWRVNWLRCLVGRAVSDCTVMSPADLLRVSLLVGCQWDTRQFSKKLAAAVKQARESGVAVKLVSGSSWCTRGNVWESLASIADDQVVDVVLPFLGRLFFDEGEPQPTARAKDVEAIAAHLKIDLAAAWRAQDAQSTSWRRSWWQLATIAELSAAGGRAKAPLPGRETKQGWVDCLTSHVLDLPAELAGKGAKAQKHRGTKARKHA